MSPTSGRGEVRTIKGSRLYPAGSCYCGEDGDHYANYLLLLTAAAHRCWLDLGRLVAARDAGVYLSSKELAEIRELARFLVEARKWAWYFDESHL